MSQILKQVVVVAQVGLELEQAYPFQLRAVMAMAITRLPLGLEALAHQALVAVHQVVIVFLGLSHLTVVEEEALIHHHVLMRKVVDRGAVAMVPPTSPQEWLD